MAAVGGKELVSSSSSSNNSNQSNHSDPLNTSDTFHPSKTLDPSLKINDDDDDGIMGSGDVIHLGMKSSPNAQKEPSYTSALNAFLAKSESFENIAPSYMKTGRNGLAVFSSWSFGQPPSHSTSPIKRNSHSNNNKVQPKGSLLGLTKTLNLTAEMGNVQNPGSLSNSNLIEDGNYVPGYTRSKEGKVFMKSLYEQIMKNRESSTNLVYAMYGVYVLRALSILFNSATFSSTSRSDRLFLSFVMDSVSTCVHLVFLLISLVVFNARDLSLGRRISLAASSLVTYLICDFIFTFIKAPGMELIETGKYRHLILSVMIAGKYSPISWKQATSMLITFRIISLTYYFLQSPGNEAVSNAPLISRRTTYSDVIYAFSSSILFYFTIRYLENQCHRRESSIRMHIDRVWDFYRHNDLRTAMIEGKFANTDVLRQFEKLKTLNEDCKFLWNQKANGSGKELFRNLMDTLSELDYLITNLRDLQRLSSDNFTLSMTAIDLVCLCRGLTNDMSCMANVDIICNYSGFDCDYGIVYVDPYLVTKSLVHLIGNAIKYAGSDEPIVLTIANKIESSTILKSKKWMCPENLLGQIVIPSGHERKSNYKIYGKNDDSRLKGGIPNTNSLSISNLIKSTQNVNSSSSNDLKYTLSLTTPLSEGKGDDYFGDNHETSMKEESMDNGKDKDVEFDNQFETDDERACTLIQYSFSVQDCGDGIDARVWKSLETYRSPFIFREIPNHRVEKQAGTGLGLLITRKMIEKLGAKLLIESRPGLGTRANFTLVGQREL